MEIFAQVIVINADGIRRRKTMTKPQRKRKKSLVENKFAWAIETQYIDIDGANYNSFIGVYYFERKNFECVDGNRTCLFRTRKIAREHLPRLKDAFPKAKIRKVRITIKELNEP